MFCLEFSVPDRSTYPFRDAEGARRESRSFGRDCRKQPDTCATRARYAFPLSGLDLSDLTKLLSGAASFTTPTVRNFLFGLAQS